MNSKNDDLFKIILVIFIIGLTVLIIAIANPEHESQYDFNFQSSETLDSSVKLEMPVPQVANKEDEPAFMLASMEVGHNNPDLSLVKKFQTVLDRLEDKCPSESESQIANYIYKGKLIAEKKGTDQTLMEIGVGIDQSIPTEAIGLITCAEVAAAYVTLLK